MKMKQLRTWPPRFAGGGVKDIDRRMADTVLRVMKQGDKTNFLMFRMRSKSSQEYSLYLLLPEGLVKKIVSTVAPPNEITLEQMGELEIVGI